MSVLFTLYVKRYLSEVEMTFLLRSIYFYPHLSGLLFCSASALYLFLYSRGRDNPD